MRLSQLLERAARVQHLPSVGHPLPMQVAAVALQTLRKGLVGLVAEVLAH